MANFPLNKISATYGIGTTGWTVYKILTAPPINAPQTQKTPWRPPQWSDNNNYAYARTSITDSAGTAYIFDAILRLEHNQSVRITEHPVQSGANISDHAFMLPARLTLEIAMSDAMDVYTPGQFNQGNGTEFGGITKSVSAYNALVKMQADRLPLKVISRLGTYDNMLIEQINTPDDFKTLYGLRCIVNLRQIMTSQVNVVKVSSRPQASQQTNKGSMQPIQPTIQQGSLINKLEGLLH